MNVHALMVGLYPPAIRQRWGTEIAREVADSGPHAWLDTAVGAVRLWGHPSDWPETITGQTRRVLAVELVAVTTTAGLLLRAAGQAVLTADRGHPAASAWIAPIVLGVLVAAPIPQPRLCALGRLTVVTARTLIAPVVALLAMYVMANSGLIDHPTGAVHVLLLGYYWTTLSLIGLQLCKLMVRIGRIASMPSIRRLRLALLLIGTGIALAALQSLAVILQASLQPGALVLSGGLAALAAVVLISGLDLRFIAK